MIKQILIISHYMALLNRIIKKESLNNKGQAFSVSKLNKENYNLKLQALISLIKQFLNMNTMQNNGCTYLSKFEIISSSYAVNRSNT